MESITDRIIPIVLVKVGMEGPRLVTISRTRKSGNHSYRDVTVEGNTPIACLENVANALEAWFAKNAGSMVEYSAHFLEITEMDDVPDGHSYVVEFIWTKG